MTSPAQPNGAPAASDPAGQQPTTPATPPTSDPTTPDAPAAPSGAEQSPEIRNPDAYKASQEAARYRNELKAAQTRLAEFEAAKKAADEAQLSDLEKANRRLAEYQTREAQQTLAAQERITRAEVRAEAVRLGVNPQLAARIVDYSAIEFDDAGDPKNIGDLLNAAINAYGLNPQPAAAAAPQAPQVGATNPPRATGPVVINATQYSDPAFRTQFMRDYGEDLLTALNKGRAKLV